MDTVIRTAVGVALVLAGTVLLLFFRDHELWWFRGQPLGIVLAAVGAVDLAELALKRRRTTG